MLVFPKSCRFMLACLGLSIGLFLPAGLTFAQDKPQAAAADQQKPADGGNKPKKVRHRNTPLDTIMQTRIWADVPEAKDFVKEHRPDRERLKFRPVTGTDPERPKPRTPAELKDLETELEGARVSADKKAGIKPAPAASASTSKPKPATATQ